MSEELTFLKESLAKLDIKLEEEKLEKMLEYKRCVLKANENINLTSITGNKEFIELHIVDSLSLLTYLPNFSKVIDIGTGAGFPGVILKIAKPDIDITLLDSTAKKLNFIVDAIMELNLDCHILNARAEESAKDEQYREKFDLCVARAVAKLPLLCEYCIPFVRPGGSFLAMKGANIDEELLAAESLAEKMGCKKGEIKSFRLPHSEAVRNIICYEKTNASPKEYPRKNSLLKKLYS